MPTSDTQPARVAIVTGASGGIGSAVAERLAADGLSVVVHYAGKADRADALVERISDAGGIATALQADVADEAQVAAMFDQTETTYGGVDVVVHAAGIMILSPLVDFDLDDVDRMTARTSAGPSSSISTPRGGCATGVPW